MPNKLKYQVCNWDEYNQSLISRGSLELWISEKEIKNWLNPETVSNGLFIKKYSDICIECGIRIKAM